MAELLSSQQINPQDLFSENLTDLGYKALNTQGNAQEAAQWIKATSHSLYSFSHNKLPYDQKSFSL